VRAAAERQGRVFLDKIVSRVYPHLCAPIEPKRKPGRFRVGYISLGLNLNNGNLWALGWLRNHGPEFETYALNLGLQDIGSRAWERDADHYHCLHGNVQRIAEFIRSLDLDALIATDIGCRKLDYVLYSLRLARVQCTGWGAPVTSGLPNVDYYLSGDLMEPADAEAEYTEKLVRLPRSGLCYPRPGTSFWEGPFTRPDPAFHPFMAQNIRKWLPQRDPILLRVSERLGRPLKFVSLPDAEATEEFSRRLDRAAIPHEMLPVTFQLGYANYLRSADVSFDPVDWSGGNTTIQALSYGIPVVTLPGRFMRARHSLAFLQMANAAGLVAKDEEDYLNLIFDRERQEWAMSNLEIDRLYEDSQVAEALNEFLLSTQEK
jgi:predicted O-linked N-acetylglucosamine transferase (SPINDLY family)